MKIKNHHKSDDFKITYLAKIFIIFFLIHKNPPKITFSEPHLIHCIRWKFLRYLLKII